MALIRGDKLSPSLRNAVLRAYVHRNTHEHPFPLSGGTPVSDAEWLTAHAFYVTKAGTLDSRCNHCEPACLADDFE